MVQEVERFRYACDHRQQVVALVCDGGADGETCPIIL